MIAKIKKRFKYKTGRAKPQSGNRVKPAGSMVWFRWKTGVSSRLGLLRNWFRGLSRYWQHFIWAVLIGIVVEMFLHWAHDAAPVRNVQNWVLDKTLYAFSQREKVDSKAHRLPVIIAIDDTAHQAPQWGADRHLGIDHIERLISVAFDRGSTHVMVDFTLDDEIESPKAKAALDELVRKYGQLTSSGEIRHLYVARSARPNRCTPNRIDTDILRTSIWESLPASDPIARPGLVIHSVFPHYIRDPDYVVRGWHLFGIAGYEREVGQQKLDGLVMLPSPQLAYYAVLDVSRQFARQPEKLAENLKTKLPWLADHGRAERASYVSLPDRSAFAKQKLDALSDALEGQHLKKLCRDHPSVMGCSVGESQVQHMKRWEELSFARKNELVNELERHLPRPQDCRAKIQETLRNLGQANAENGQIYNRILYEMSPWSEPRLPFTSGEAWKRRGYFVFTPGDLGQFAEPNPWAGRFVAIGGAYASTGDWYQTPVGHAAGVFINVNAMNSMEQFGPVSEPPSAAKVLINLAIILMVAAIFAAMRPIGAALTSATILIGSLVVFHDVLLTNGIWIEFGAPLLGINIHRFIDDYLARRRERNALKIAEDDRLKVLGRLKLLEDRIAGSAWKQVEGGDEAPADSVVVPNNLKKPPPHLESNLKNETETP
jgi:hypothetical protein